MPRRIYREGFRLTTGPGGMWIEALDYHCSPLFLDRRRLEEIGLRLEWTGNAAERPAASEKASPPAGPPGRSPGTGTRRRRPCRRGEPPR